MAHTLSRLQEVGDELAAAPGDGDPGVAGTLRPRKNYLA